MPDAEEMIGREVLREKPSREAGGCRRRRRDLRVLDRHCDVSVRSVYIVDGRNSIDDFSNIFRSIMAESLEH